MPSRSSSATTPRPRHHVARLAAAVALGALLWVGARGAGPIPPLGLVLDPVRGAWALVSPSARSATTAASTPLTMAVTLR